jgi:DDE superfamily endonuclease
LQLERVRTAHARGTRFELWFADEARIGQKNTSTRVWGQTGGRPAAAKDLGFTSAYVFGAVCPGEGKAAAVIMPICNTIAMNHHRREISSQVGTAAHALLVLTPAPAKAGGAGWHDSQALAIPDNITLLALPPYSPELNPRAHPALSAQPLARQLGLLQSGRHHRRLRDRVEPLRRRPRLGPFAVRRRPGARLAPGLLRALYTPAR